MADQKITALTANTTPATTDILPMVDDPSGTPATQKITFENFLKVINSLTADSSPATSADYLLSYDTSASSVKKVLMNLVGKYTLMFGGHGNGGTISASTTNYICPTISGIDTAGRAYPIPRSGTLKNLYFRLGSSQPASGSLVLEIFAGSAGTTATGVKITVAAGSAAGTYSDTSNTYSHSAGDLVNVKIINNATGASGTIGGVSFELETSLI